MVIWFEFRIEQYRDDDRREDATLFRIEELTYFHVPVSHISSAESFTANNTSEWLFTSMSEHMNS